MNIRESVNLVSGFIPAGATMYFAYDLLYVKGVPLSLMSWILILVLDALAFVLVRKGGVKWPWLLISWTVAAACVVIAIMIKGGELKITLVEIVTLALLCFAVAQWLRSGKPLVGLRWQTIALWVSSIPMFHDFWIKPQNETWWLWAITLACCCAQVATTKDKMEINILVQCSAIALNAVMLALIYR